MSENSNQGRRRRRSLFWPILLIVVGSVILLDNLGVLPGDAWSNIFRLWPLLFIAWGLDGLWQRQGIIGPTILIGFGVVFLLSNFGMLALTGWQVIFNLWPVLLIAVGLDILIGRRSILGTLLGLVVVIAVLIGALWFMGSGASGNLVRGMEVHQDLSDAKRARLIIEPGAGTLELNAMLEPVALVTGSVPDISGISISEDYTISGDTATYHLRSKGGIPFYPTAGNSYVWDLKINPEVPVELQISLGAGNARLGLGKLMLDDLRFEMGVGQATIYLPPEGVFDAKIDAAVGQLVIVVPKDIGLRITKDTAIVVVSFPKGYHVDGDVYTSAGYSSADQRSNLTVDMAIGQLLIREE